MADELEVTVLPDGSVKIDSPKKISGANHRAADMLFQELAKAGETVRRRSDKAKAHTHTHAEGGHEHTH